MHRNMLLSGQSLTNAAIRHIAQGVEPTYAFKCVAKSCLLLRAAN